MNCNVKYVLSVVAMQAAAVAVHVQAAPLDGIPMGDFSGFSGSTPDHVITGVGEWQSYASANASRAIVGTGAPAHVELFQEWTSAGAAAWYTSDTATSTTEAWKVGADMKWDREPVAADDVVKYFLLMSGDENTPTVFGLGFRNSKIEYYTPTGNGNYTPTVDIGADYHTAIIDYDPVSGALSATWGSETVFSTTTTAGLTIRTAYFGNFAEGKYRPGTLHVDNVFAQAVPEPTFCAAIITGAMLAFGRTRRRGA